MFIKLIGKLYFWNVFFVEVLSIFVLNFYKYGGFENYKCGWIIVFSSWCCELISLLNKFKIIKYVISNDFRLFNIIFIIILSFVNI